VFDLNSYEDLYKPLVEKSEVSVSRETMYNIHPGTRNSPGTFFSIVMVLYGFKSQTGPRFFTPRVVAVGCYGATTYAAWFLQPHAIVAQEKRERDPQFCNNSTIAMLFQRRMPLLESRQNKPEE